MKHALRKKFLHIRNNLDTTYQIQATEKIFKTLEESDIFKNSQKIFIYIGFGSEIQTEYLIKKYIDSKEIFVPKIVNGVMKLVKIKNWAGLSVGHFNVLEPIQNDFYTEGIDLVITPSIVFDKNGYRLGYGKGYYDKYFSENKYKTSLGLSFEKLLQEEIPKEKHDKNVDLIITEERIIVINEKHSSNY